ncbi:uncharacterized protein LOC119956582 [Scyliorhinus canicula]|uniref:uncharacterized protein LOC119956582 n=1 Tax=Scyliorhinus canicula TaxID=7830 RepID=UPI0018F390BB|nr:uncharacterized protein LOC119956582 [Scyliorhinus canicula]
MMMESSRRLTGLIMLFYSCHSQLLVDYNIVLCNGDLSRLATLVWLQPAHCLFEMWAVRRADQIATPPASASITVEILRGDNGTFVLTQKYSVPPCTDFSPEPTELAYRMGPSIACKNGSCIEHVLPGQSFRVRYVVLDSSANPLVMTRWSESITTRDDPPSYLSIHVWDAGMRSGNMVVITVLLVVTLSLLFGFAITMTVRWK